MGDQFTVSPDDLSPYWKKICSLISEGYSNPEIAGMVHSTTSAISVTTVRIFRKVGVKNRVSLAIWFDRNRQQRA